MQATTTSKTFTLNVRDFIRGLYMAAILPALTIIQQSIEKGELTFNWKLIGLTALGGFVAYLIKNFLSPAEVIVKDLPKETIEAVQDGAATITVKPQ